jgi:hypothetical protein
MTTIKMPEPKPVNADYLIRCPSCGQRFKVGDDLLHKTVECGTCEHRFRINDDVIVRGKRVYPGERKNAALGRFQRFPISGSMAKDRLQQVQYAEVHDPHFHEPTSALRLLAAICGGVVMILMVLLLILGADYNSFLDGISTRNRLAMAVFASVLGSGLILYGNPKTRLKAWLYCGGASLTIMALPLFFTKASESLRASRTVAPQAGSPASAPLDESTQEQKSGLDALKEKIGTDPLEQEITRYREEGGQKTAIGLWLRGLHSKNRLLVRDFILRTLNADPQTHFYPRGGEDYLMVVSGVVMPLDVIVKAVEPLGSVEMINHELEVIEILINNSNFVEGPLEKLNNKRDPAFYELNKRELESIDMDRVSRAVRRLMDAEPVIYQNDIVSRLTKLLEADYVDFKGDVCQALMRWSNDLGPAADVALRVLEKTMQSRSNVSKKMVELIVLAGDSKAIPFVDKLWQQSPVEWEYLYSLTGPEAEPLLLENLKSAEGSQRQSVVRLLGRVGTGKSVGVLQSFSEATDQELRVLARKSLSQIREREGE